MSDIAQRLLQIDADVKKSESRLQVCKQQLQVSCDAVGKKKRRIVQLELKAQRLAAQMEQQAQNVRTSSESMRRRVSEGVSADAMEGICVVIASLFPRLLLPTFERYILLLTGQTFSLGLGGGCEQSVISFLEDRPHLFRVEEARGQRHVALSAEANVPVLVESVGEFISKQKKVSAARST